MNIKDAVIIVTGASRGIGKAMALRFSSRGANIVLAARNRPAMEAFSGQLSSPYLIVKTDVCLENSVRNLVKKTFTRFGRIDALINNAGFIDPYDIIATPLEVWEQTLRTNLTGTFLVTREVLQYMQSTGGKIINIASTAGLGPRPGWSAYAASKAAVINFSMSIAPELQSHNIAVFCLCPSGTATDMRKRLRPAEDPRTILQPEEVVNVAEYCLSDEGAVLDAQPIVIQGHQRKTT